MTTLLLILLKFSLTITAIWFFYKLVLEKLTFFVPNRFFFLGGISIAFFIAIGRFEWIDTLFNYQFGKADLGQYVPAIQAKSQQFFNPIAQLTALSPILLTIYGLGVMALGIHLVIQYASYLKLKRGAFLREMYGQEVYIVQQDILPFSFGQSIFISESAADNPEIGKILLHESIHIQQHHSVDVLMIELVRIINWMNPFAWLLKKSIHQNLEFLTDDLIINKGIDKRTYQYLLLHFSGNNTFSLVTNFNFYSLKTRISKMNQNKSNRMQYSRFLLFIPMVLVLMFVFSCMNEETAALTPKSKKMDEVTFAKLKLDLKDPVVEVDAANQMQFTKMDKAALLGLKKKLRDAVVEMDAKDQNLSKKVYEVVIDEPQSKYKVEGLELSPTSQDLPRKTLLLQKIEKSSQEAVERRPPPPPPAMPEKQ